MQPFIDLFANWFPLVIALAVVVYLARVGGMRAKGSSGRTMLDIYELHLEEIKRNTATLERIAQALEARNARPPGASS